MPAEKSFTISVENHAHATVAAATSVNPAFHHTLEPTTQPSAQPGTDHLRVQVTAVLGSSLIPVGKGKIRGKVAG